MADNHVMLRCSHCGTTAKYATPADFKFAVPEYLDGRPFEKDGFSIKNAVMCCPKCGYASFNVSKNILTDTRIIYRDEYEEIIKSDFLPKYINSYIAVGYIYENQKEYYNAAHAYLCAAWGCMDEGKKQESLILLENAAKLLLKHIGSEEFKAHPDLEKIQYAVDVLRQMRQFENAKKLAAYALRRDLPEKLRTIFLLEESLCDNYISKPHAYIPEKDTTIMSFEDLFRRFAESVNQDEKEKLRVYKEAFDFVNTVKCAQIVAGVDVLYNPVYNRSFDFNSTVEKFRKIAENAEEYSVKEDSTPKVYAPKVLSKIDDVLPEKKEEQIQVQEEIQQLEDIQSMEETVPNEDVQPVEETVPFVNVQPVGEIAPESTDDRNALEEEFSNRVFVRESAPVISEKQEEFVENKENITLPEEQVEDNSKLNGNFEDFSADILVAENDAQNVIDVQNEFEQQEEQIEQIEQEEIIEQSDIQLSEETEIVEEVVEDSLIEEQLEEESQLLEENVDIKEEILSNEEQLKEEQSDDELDDEEEFEEEDELDDAEEDLEEDDELDDEEELEEEDELDNDDEEDLEEEIEEELLEEEEEESTQTADLGLSYEQLRDTILTVSEIDGIISISEVQALFEYGYMQAKNLLDKMVKEGWLSHSDDGQVYGFIKKA